MDPNPNAHPVAAEARLRRPPVEAVDLDPARRPGVPKERPPEPWPNSRFPPEPMGARPSAPKHGRPGKPLPPVYGTAVPPRGLSGAIREAAYRYPDHLARHWLLLLLADRVDAWRPRTRRLLQVVAPLALLVIAGAGVWRVARR